jgi:hypothetical protein
VKRQRQVEVDGIKHTEYYYKKEWCDCFSFPNEGHDSHHLNPTVIWPFSPQTFEANNVKLGGFRLNPIQCSRLGKTETPYEWTDQGAAAIQKTASKMCETGFEPFVYRDGYFYSSAVRGGSASSPHIGQYRVRFDYCKCGPVSVIA